MKIAGAVLMVLGLVALAAGGFPYDKTDNVAQIGDIKMSVTQKKQAVIPPLVSGLAVLAGAVMFFKPMGKRGA